MLFKITSCSNNVCVHCMVRVLTGNLQRVLRLQKRSARAILDADTLANSVELFVKLN